MTSHNANRVILLVESFYTQNLMFPHYPFKSNDSPSYAPSQVLLVFIKLIKILLYVLYGESSERIL